MENVRFLLTGDTSLSVEFGNEISEEIKSAVDYVVPKPFGAGATGRSSQIIKLGLGGEVEILRP